MACSSCSRRALPRTDVTKVNNLQPNAVPPPQVAATPEVVTPIIDMAAKTASAMARMFRRKT